jgi:hypothetical protein
MTVSEAPVLVAQSIFTMFDAISLIASIASLILAVVAISLSLSFKKDSDSVNRNTSEILVDIKSESKAISQGVMSELKEYGKAMRGTFGQNTSDSSTFSGSPSGLSLSNNKTNDG